MKLRELLPDQGEPPRRKLKFPVDDNADPPITYEEALAATSATCPAHGGLIGQRGEKVGMVYLCLHRQCRMYRRYTKHPSWRKLKYPAKGII